MQAPDELMVFADSIVTISFPDGTRVIRPAPPGTVEGPFPFEGPVHIVTAFNPGSEIDDAHRNERRYRDLLSAVDAMGANTLATVGSAPDGSLAEPGVLVVGISRIAALELGRRFAQTAVYEWRRDGLEILGALVAGSIVLGWTIGDAV